MAESIDIRKPYRENAEQLRARGDLRDMQTAECFDCGYEWLAPAVGRCPRCHGGVISVIAEEIIGAPRV